MLFTFLISLSVFQSLLFCVTISFFFFFFFFLPTYSLCFLLIFSIFGLLKRFERFPSWWYSYISQYTNMTDATLLNLQTCWSVKRYVNNPVIYKSNINKTSYQIKKKISVYQDREKVLKELSQVECDHVDNLCLGHYISYMLTSYKFINTFHFHGFASWNRSRKSQSMMTAGMFITDMGQEGIVTVTAAEGLGQGLRA